MIFHIPISSCQTVFCKQQAQEKQHWITPDLKPFPSSGSSPTRSFNAFSQHFGGDCLAGSEYLCAQITVISSSFCG